MPLLGTAILAVWNEVDPAIEPDFNDWYLREHVPERLSVPGMNRGRRYRAEAGTPRYMAFYEAASMDVLTQGPYRTQLDNPTAWTQRIMPHFRFAQRGLCDVAASLGDGIGSAAAVAASDPERRAATARMDHRKAVARTMRPPARRRRAFMDPGARRTRQPDDSAQPAGRARSSARLGCRRRDG